MSDLDYGQLYGSDGAGVQARRRGGGSRVIDLTSFQRIIGGQGLLRWGYAAGLTMAHTPGRLSP
jgi:hypothetical protein